MRSHSNWISKTLGVAILLSSLAIAPANAKKRYDVKYDAYGVPMAAPEAAADRVAYSYQKRAIQKLKKLIGKSKKPKTEAALLFRMAVLLEEHADVTFRIAHAEAFYSKQRINLKNYKTVLRQMVKVLNKLIDRYSKHTKLANAYRMRAEAFDELGLRESAIRDYRFLVNNFPKLKLVSAAYLALGDFSEEEKRYKQAIRYYKKAATRKNVEPDYPYAIFKLAWNYYYLNKIPEAFSYVEKYQKFYNKKIKDATKAGKKRAVLSAQVMRDDMLIDAVLFYTRGLELGKSRYNVPQALGYFKDLARGPNTEDVFGRMILRFTKLIRSRGFERKLVDWKARVMKHSGDRPEMLDLLLLVYEDQNNRYRYQRLIDTGRDIVQLKQKNAKGYEFRKAENWFLKSAERIQKALVRGIEVREVRKGTKSKSKKQAVGKDRKLALSLYLAEIYQNLLNILDDRGKRYFQIRFNLAEAYSSSKRFDKALNSYIWIMRNGRNAGDAGLSQRKS